MIRYFVVIISFFVIIVVFLSIADAQTSSSFPLDIVWGADTYVPASFGGKALPVRGSQIRIAALTPTQNPNNIEFTWSIKDSSSFSATAELKGRGENTFVLQTEDIIPNFVHEIVLTARNVLTGKANRTTIFMPLHKPEAQLVPPIPATVGDTPLAIGSENKFIALPLYFSVRSLDELTFLWKVGSQTAQNTERENILTLRINPQTVVGVSQQIDLNIENKNRPRETARSSIRFITTQ